MDPSESQSEAVEAYWREFAQASGVTGEPADAFAFGDSPELAHELAALVVAGTKQATAGLMADYDEDDSLPVVGDHSVVLGGDGTPVGIIRTTEVRVGPLSSVDAQFAWDEGEGDRSLEWWMNAHEGYFRRRCSALGLEFHGDVTVVFERFELVWPQ